MYRIKNSFGSYLFVCDKVVAFSSKENASLFVKSKAEEWMSKLYIFYGSKTNFEIEAICG